MKGMLVFRRGVLTPAGWEAKIEVRCGARGRGQQIGNTIVYWPWSDQSEEKAYAMAYAIAERAGLELVQGCFED